MAVIAVDWDHTLMNGKEWLPGAQTMLKRLREEGHKIVIHSCNSKGWIERNLRNAGIVVDGIWDDKTKPLADLYIDDKAYRFPSDGEWNQEQLTNVLDLIKGMDNRKME